MRIIRRPDLHSVTQGTALTIGKFDGIHLGHTQLFREVALAAETNRLIPTVVTFEPHPKEFFNPSFKLDRIATLRNRIISMSNCGIEQVCILPFNKAMADLSPLAFVHHILLGHLKAKHIWVGDDFQFGAQRAGNVTLLKVLGETEGFTVHDLPEVQSMGARVSSSNIREALKAGEIQKAVCMLGHPLMYSGRVIHGKKLGRTLGFPTLNMRIKGRASALTGILAVWVHGLSEKPLPAVASLGTRPTIGHCHTLLLETHIPNWQGNAYGQLIHIEVLAHLRPEIRFDSIEAMKQQMHIDTQQALTLLAQHNPQITNTGC